jgi:hypothetical protein
MNLRTFIQNIHCGTGSTLSFKIGNELTVYQSQSFDDSENKGKILFRFFGFVSCASISKDDPEPLCFLSITFPFFLPSSSPCFRLVLPFDLLEHLLLSSNL